MNKICTSLEQSKKLIELGVEENTADMYYGYDYNSPIGGYEEDAQIIPQSESDQHFSLFPEDIPAWSLSALLGLMPTFTINGYGNGQFNCRDERANNYALVDTCPLDAAFEMVCWLKENEKI